jgi:CDP-diacylglycerol--serine O-phosphatidyltransferase
MPCAEQKLTICTPYFNLPAVLVRNIIQLLRDGKKVEIIVGDKTANDFLFRKISRLKSSARCLICMRSTCVVS